MPDPKEERTRESAKSHDCGTVPRLGLVENRAGLGYDLPMAQEDQELLRSVLRSIDKKIQWEPLSSKDDKVRINLRTSFGEAIVEIPGDELEAAHDGGAARNQLRERLKRGRKRILDSRPIDMPWVLPKIEPVGAPGPRGGWGGGRR